MLSGAAPTVQLLGNLRAVAVDLDGGRSAELHAAAEEPAASWRYRAALRWH